MALLDNIFGGGLGALVKSTVGAFKLDPEKKAEFQAAIDANSALIEQKQLELQGKLQDAVSQEVQASADIIKTEAQSQSWLPRNVRPLLLLMWGSLITFNFVAPMIAHLFHTPIEPLTLDPWVYRLTIIGYTGYISMRSLEKVLNADK